MRDDSRMTAETTLSSGVLQGNPLGMYKSFRRDPIGFLASTRRIGDVVQIPSLSGKPSFICHHPQVVRAVLALHEDKVMKGTSAKVLGLTLGEGLLTSEAPKHQRQKRQLQGAFHAQMIESVADDIVRLTEERIQAWDGTSPLVVSQELLDLTLDIVFEGLFGVEVGASRAILHQIIEQSVQYGANRLMQAVPLPFWMPTPANRRQKQAVEQFDKVIQHIIQMAPVQPSRPTVLSYIQSLAADEQSGVTATEMRDELATFIIGGHETTANLLGWALYLLAEHPDIRDSLFHEVDHALHGRRPTYADSRNLPRVRQVIRETLRLFPPAWTLLRDTVAPMTVGDVEIPSGAALIISPYLIHRDARWFHHPEEFQPARFDDKTGYEWPRFAYIPFGAGSRTCIGNTFALTEATLVLASILQRFTWIVPASCVVVPEASVSLRIQGGLKAVFRSRREHQVNAL